MFSTTEACQTGAGKRILWDHPDKLLSLFLTGEIFASLSLYQSRSVVSLTLPLGIEKQRKTTRCSTHADIHVPHLTPHARDCIQKSAAKATVPTASKY